MGMFLNDSGAPSTKTLTGAYTLKKTDTSVFRFDCGGAARSITMYTGRGFGHRLINASDGAGEDGTILSAAGTTLGVLSPGEEGIVYLEADGTARMAIYGANSDPSLTVTAHEEFFGVAGDTLPAGWTTDQNASGTGDYVSALSGGVYALGLTTANAAEDSNLLGYQVDMSSKPRVKFRFRVDGAPLTSVERMAIGLINAHATSETSIDASTYNAIFRMEGTALDLLWETDDATTNDDDNDTTVNLVDDTWLLGEIYAPSLATVYFYLDEALVGAGDMSDLPANTVLRCFAAMQRDDNTQTEAAEELEIDYFDVKYARV